MNRLQFIVSSQNQNSSSGKYVKVDLVRASDELIDYFSNTSRISFAPCFECYRRHQTEYLFEKEDDLQRIQMHFFLTQIKSYLIFFWFNKNYSNFVQSRS